MDCQLKQTALDQASETAQRTWAVDEAEEAMAHCEDAMKTFSRQAGLQKMYWDSLIREGLPIPAAIACLTAYSQEAWNDFFEGD